jgi:hypothetical protein
MARSARGTGSAVDARRRPGGYDAVVVDTEGVLTRSTPPSVARYVAVDAFATVGVDDPEPSDLDALVDPDVETVVAVADRYGVDPETFWRRRDERAVLAREASIRSGWGDSHEDVVAARTVGIDAVRLERATGRWTGNDEPTGIRSLRALALLVGDDVDA